MGRSNKRRVSRSEELEHLDELPWSSTAPGKDPFSVLAGPGASLDGGFFSLEEIDEVDFSFAITDLDKTDHEGQTEALLNKKKRKREKSDGTQNEVFETETMEGMGDEADLKQKTKRKKKNKTKLGARRNRNNPVAETETKEEDEEELVDEDEFNAWNELRLHPLLMKAIHKLGPLGIGFKEPTPIQKACIPAAAHQGKDVVGAAETGSGKTLAFGLPILQRLLDEQEKVDKHMLEDGEAIVEVAPGRVLRALIITPTRELAIQVTKDLRAASRCTNFQVVPIVGGMSTEKQERLLRGRPEIVVGTPGRLWELMSGGDIHLVELHSLSFFVLDEADRMIEDGHFRELQSIIDMLPAKKEHSQNVQDCMTLSSFQRKKRQTFVFSATLALSSDFRKKLKHGSLKSKVSTVDGLSSMEALSERAGMRPDAAIVDLTNASIMASKLVESFLECTEENKDSYLYYILSVHGQGRTIVFCSSIPAVRRVSDLLRILKVTAWTLHSKMQQRARLKALDRFRENEHGVLVATDAAARGLDIHGVRTVIHYQLPHEAKDYVHRSGRTARASADGCSVALISANDWSKFADLCKVFTKDALQQFPIQESYMTDVLKRLSLAVEIHKISRNASKEKDKNRQKRVIEAMELTVEDSDSEEERADKCMQKKAIFMRFKKGKEELHKLLSRPLQPKFFSHRFLAGAGVSPLVQQQLEQMAQQRLGKDGNKGEISERQLVVIGQDCVEPLQALRNAGPEIRMDFKARAEKQRNMDTIRKKRRESKKRQKEQKREQRKRQKEAANCE